jgi:hypothetical protein
MFRLEKLELICSLLSIRQLCLELRFSSLACSCLHSLFCFSDLSLCLHISLSLISLSLSLYFPISLLDTDTRTRTRTRARTRTQLCLAAEHAPIYAHVVAFATEQGRMKFTRTLYRELNKVAPQLAKDTFAAHRANYHSICAKMVARDLGV